jgi:predicted polyphosphate/ATP-dependent NAD kinase
MMKRICLVINPIAGMGGRVGLKGTDGVVEKAMEKGAEPRAGGRAREALTRLREAYGRHRLKEEIMWFTASGRMGEDLLSELKHDMWTIEVVHSAGDETTADDTIDTVIKAVEMDAEIILFCGGDGTARDVLSASGGVPIFGIPSGVKMHSGVFAVDPSLAGELMEFYIRGEMTTGEGEVMDLDEDRYRNGDWNIKLFGKAVTLYEPAYVQVGKFIVEAEGMENFLSEIADDIGERIGEEPNSLFILGPGGTLERIGEEIGIDKTHLGVDAVKGKEQVGKDLDQRSILKLLENQNDSPSYIIVSPIGGQGFFLGRGNLQIGPDVIRKVGLNNIVVVSVPQKLDRTDALRVDTGDHSLDEEFREMGSLKVLTGYRTYRLKKIR